LKAILIYGDGHIEHVTDAPGARYWHYEGRVFEMHAAYDGLESPCEDVTHAIVYLERRTSGGGT